MIVLWPFLRWKCLMRLPHSYRWPLIHPAKENRTICDAIFILVETFASNSVTINIDATLVGTSSWYRQPADCITRAHGMADVRLISLLFFNLYFEPYMNGIFRTYASTMWIPTLLTTFGDETMLVVLPMSVQPKQQDLLFTIARLVFRWRFMFDHIGKKNYNLY